MSGLFKSSAMILLLSVLTPLCALSDDCATLRAVEGVIEGMPVPEGSILERDTYYRDDEGVEMASYSHPRLSGAELLQFFDVCMPRWGWEVSDQDYRYRLQRSYSKNGVPVLIGVDKREDGTSFNILKGVAGDWGCIPSLRPD
jgi:hypothetical protein